MPRVAASVLVTIVGSVWILASYHDRSWWPPDEGQFAHLAERMLDGERLHLDVHDPHTDYGHWLNAAALAVFGRDLVSLRYAPATASLLVACGIWLLLRERGVWLACCAALAATALGFVQFPNPTPNWFGPLGVVGAALCLRDRAPRGALAVGAVVGLLFGFRQLTGVFVGVGALAVLLMSAEADNVTGPPRLARALLAAMVLGLASYLFVTTDALGWALFGFWPLALLVFCAATVRTPDVTAAAALWRFVAGAAAALAPMLLVHTLDGSLAAWWRDVVESALSVPRLGYLERASYADWFAVASAALLAPSSPLALANGLYLVVLLLVGTANGVWLLGALARRRTTARDAVLPILASCHALVAVLNQIPIYVYYGAGLSLAGWLWTLQPRSSRARAAVGSGALGMAALGLAFHAAQPHTRSFEQQVLGQRATLVENQTVPRAALWMEPDQERAYRDLIARIHALTAVEDRLLVVPNDAEVYFLAQRRSAVNFWSSALGIGDAASEARLVEQLRADPPALIVHARGDRSTTPALLRVLEAVDDLYDPAERVHYFELSQRSQARPPPR